MGCWDLTWCVLILQVQSQLGWWALAFYVSDTSRVEQFYISPIAIALANTKIAQNTGKILWASYRLKLLLCIGKSGEHKCNHSRRFDVTPNVLANDVIALKCRTTHFNYSFQALIFLTSSRICHKGIVQHLWFLIQTWKGLIILSVNTWDTSSW